MTVSLIPWQEFRDALRQQPATSLQLWLLRWMFTNDGVILADEHAPSAN